MKTIYYNGDIISFNDQDIQAVVVDGDYIIDMGDYLVMEDKYPGVNHYDLNKQCLCPGFIDAHSHLSSLAFSFLQVSLGNLHSLKEIKEGIDKYIVDNQINKGEFINCMDFDDSLLINEILDKNFLDDNFRDYLVFINHKSGHSGILNSNCLSYMNLVSDNGIINEVLYMDHVKKIPMPGFDKIIMGYQKAYDLYLSYGITTVQDGYVVKEMLPMYQYMSNNDICKVDTIGYVDYNDLSFFNDLELNEYHHNLKIGGIKIFLDGSPQIKTAWMRDHYVGEIDNYGISTLSDERLKEVLVYAATNKRQVLAHCNGDKAVDQYLKIVGEVYKTYPQVIENRNVIIHSQFLQKDQLDEVVRLKMIPSFFVAHIYYFADIHIKNVGYEKAKSMSLANSALSKNIIFTFHQDSPVILPNMLETIQSACLRKTKTGVLLDQSENLPVLQAIKAVTLNSAYQYYEETVKGSIEVGKDANFVVLSSNPLKVDVDKIKDINVVHTIVKGKELY
ncbi:MAG: amidohydrolase family protein [Erysipelotrichaceae bacterium]